MSEQKKNTAFQIAGVLGLAGLLALTLWLQHHSGSHGSAPHDHADPAQYAQGPTSETSKPEDQGLGASGTLEGGRRIIDYEAFQYGFAPDPLVVFAGEEVTLRVTSTDVEHGMMIPELDVSSAMPVGSPKEVRFTAPSEPVRLTVFCSVFCGTGHGGMKGMLIVRAREGAANE